MNQNRVLIWGAVLLAGAAVVWYRSRIYSEPPQPPAANILFVTGGTDPYWQLAAAGAREAAEEYDVDLSVEMPEAEESVEDQMRILGQLEFSEVNGLAVSPLDAEGQTLLINRLSDKMAVVTFDSDAPLSERQYYIGTSNYEAGAQSAQLVREAVPDGGEIAVFQANLTKSNNQERKEGFDEAINLDDEGELEERYQVVGNFEDLGSTETCEANVRAVLKDHPEVKCLVGLNGYHGPAFLRVLSDAGKLGEVALVVFDDFSETLDGIEAGHIYATVAQDPFQYGHEAVRVLTEIVGTSKRQPVLGRGMINFHAKPVRQSDLEEYRTRIEQQQAKTANTATAQPKSDPAPETREPKEAQSDT